MQAIRNDFQKKTDLSPLEICRDGEATEVQLIRARIINVTDWRWVCHWAVLIKSTLYVSKQNDFEDSELC